ncbi:hypothetical protein NL676_016339 [Syzygium grande]|nr:hypothetical protein NL676_016339 [Syzygium grande]
MDGQSSPPRTIRPIAVAFSRFGLSGKKSSRPGPGAVWGIPGGHPIFCAPVVVVVRVGPWGPAMDAGGGPISCGSVARHCRIRASLSRLRGRKAASKTERLRGLRNSSSPFRQ